MKQSSNLVTLPCASYSILSAILKLSSWFEQDPCCQDGAFTCRTKYKINLSVKIALHTYSAEFPRAKSSSYKILTFVGAAALGIKISAPVKGSTAVNM